MNVNIPRHPPTPSYVVPGPGTSLYVYTYMLYYIYRILLQCRSRLNQELVVNNARCEQAGSGTGRVRYFMYISPISKFCLVNSGVTSWRRLKLYKLHVCLCVMMWCDVMFFCNVRADFGCVCMEKENISPAVSTLSHLSHAVKRMVRTPAQWYVCRRPLALQCQCTRESKWIITHRIHVCYIW